MASTLMLHKGGRQVPRAYITELAAHTPPPQGRWHPVSHARILDMLTDRLADAGFDVQRQQIGLSVDDSCMFAVLDLLAKVSDEAGGITLACGVINSMNKKLAARLVLGSRVFCCDNLSLSGSVLLARKHTTNILRFLEEGIPSAIKTLAEFQKLETLRLIRFQRMALPEIEADGLLLRAFDAHVVNHVQLRRTIQAWRNPADEAFRPRTLFSLENAFTTVLSDVLAKNPVRFASLSLRLQGLLGAEHVGIPLPQAVEETPFSAE